MSSVAQQIVDLLVKYERTSGLTCLEIVDQLWPKTEPVKKLNKCLIVEANLMKLSKEGHVALPKGSDYLTTKYTILRKVKNGTC